VTFPDMRIKIYKCGYIIFNTVTACDVVIAESQVPIMCQKYGTRLDVSIIGQKKSLLHVANSEI